MSSTKYNELGAHLTKQGGVNGTRFAVWAPNAREVSVVCESNNWQRDRNRLSRGDDGVWSSFISGIQPGEKYKYSVVDVHGNVTDKADPYAFEAEYRPATASIVCDLDGYSWADDEWMKFRQSANWLERPVSIYEVHPGSWRRPEDGRDYFTWEELADQLIDYCHELGYSHLQLMPVTEHPFDGSWGYQVTGYFAPTSRFGTPHEFMLFVDHCHQAGIGVLVDWVPAHFPTDAHGLGRFDGTGLYEHEDHRKGYHPDWNTYIFNYGRTEVREFLLSSARFWCDLYHVDGLRVDAVASMLYLDYSRDSGQWVPNEHGGRENHDAISFIKEFNEVIHREFPGVVTIAEESTSWPKVSRPLYDGGLGFTMKWDMGWMHDTLKYTARDPIHRTHHQNDLSFRMMYAFSENFVLPLSHDEVVHGKKSLLSRMPGDEWQQFANLRLLFSYQFTMPGKKLQFMGGEIAQWNEWNHDAELDWSLLKFPNHAGISRLVKDLNRLYCSNPAMHQFDTSQEGFQWIDCDDAEKSTYSFIRRSSDHDDFFVIALSFTPVVREEFRIGVPKAGYYREAFNTDADIYGGSNVGNKGGMYSEPVAAHGFENSLSITLPPLAMTVFRIVRID
ncbi:MAG: 1,4-alpha-glucan branching protein GlgB [Planctomycetota bacterium]|nr:1,4-alpha-glucan branching protein GlgB [Planctomycetota bacterium]MDA0917448.1 1,4-alpha-glucan branching protein GlgB [Planctomycetota bacterium]